MRAARPVHRLELRLRELAQLFNSLDPAPFLNRDLDRDAEEYIESWAMEYPPDSHYHITVHLQELPAEPDPEAVIGAAIHNYYGYKGQLAQRELHRLLRQGRRSLVIGLGFLALCLTAADLLDRVTGGSLLELGRQSLTIIGWVALWRPIQIFLYDWWPLTRRRKTYQALSGAVVRVAPATAREPARTGFMRPAVATGG